VKLLRRTLDQISSPLAQAHALLQGYKGVRSVLDLSAGAPSYPTAHAISRHIAEVACAEDGGKYTSRPGLDQLRKLVAKEISSDYGGDVSADNVLITAGCNQAFCLAISAIADAGDEVILPVPYYFNHDMWLRLNLISPRYLFSDRNLVPDPERAESLISGKTRAIVLVSPGNPTGLTIPPSAIRAFADLAREREIMLILDETYRVFRDSDQPAHELFRHGNWQDTVVSLHSFSKEFAIPGHRVGAAICHPDLLAEMLKLLDCVAICAPRLGQEAAIAGFTHAKEWRATKARELRQKQVLFERAIAENPAGFELHSAGAFFGWVRHPILREPTESVVRRLMLEQGVLTLPGTIFTPTDDRYLRLSFAGLSADDANDLIARLSIFARER
jgi:aspartate/methionine/tyrosine aminotransferase